MQTLDRATLLCRGAHAHAALALAALLAAGAAPALAAEAAPDPADLARRIEQLERTVSEQQATIRTLQQTLASLSQAPPSEAAAPQPASPAAPGGGQAPPPSGTTDLEQQLARELGQTSPAAPGPEVGPARAAPAQGTYANLSMDALMAAGGSTARDIETLEPGGHDPVQRGVTVQNVEAVLEGAVDPYFRGQANAVLLIGPAGDTQVELEEAYLTTSSLPANLQVKAGQFVTEFGRLNPQHPHQWDFADVPLVSARVFGRDGLRGAGARLSWLMPLPVYSELFVTVQNARGETATSFGWSPGESQFGRPITSTEIRSARDLLVTPRWAVSFDPAASHTLLLGTSAAFGPNGSGSGGRTRIYGLDGTWKWKPPRSQRGFPFFKVQTEAIARAWHASTTDLLPAATFRDWGTYAQAVWGFRTGWVAGLRWDRVAGDVGDDPLDPFHEHRTRASANMTWYPTEFSKLRLQYDHDIRTVSKDADSVWLQFEFLLGAHAAHTF